MLGCNGNGFRGLGVSAFQCLEPHKGPAADSVHVGEAHGDALCSNACLPKRCSSGHLQPKHFAHLCMSDVYFILGSLLQCKMVESTTLTRSECRLLLRMIS